MSDLYTLFKTQKRNISNIINIQSSNLNDQNTKYTRKN